MKFTGLTQAQQSVKTNPIALSTLPHSASSPLQPFPVSPVLASTVTQLISIHGKLTGCLNDFSVLLKASQSHINDSRDKAASIYFDANEDVAVGHALSTSELGLVGHDKCSSRESTASSSVHDDWSSNESSLLEAAESNLLPTNTLGNNADDANATSSSLAYTTDTHKRHPTRASHQSSINNSPDIVINYLRAFCGDFPATMVRRDTLPSKTITNQISILSILRKNIGKDLSAVTMPIALNEPLNLLQKQCEDMEYCELLRQATEQPSSLDRMKFVVAFAISGI